MCIYIFASLNSRLESVNNLWRTGNNAFFIAPGLSLKLVCLRFRIRYLSGNGRMGYGTAEEDTTLEVLIENAILNTCCAKFVVVFDQHISHPC